MSVLIIWVMPLIFLDGNSSTATDYRAQQESFGTGDAIADGFGRVAHQQPGRTGHRRRSLV